MHERSRSFAAGLREADIRQPIEHAQNALRQECLLHLDPEFAASVLSEQRVAVSVWLVMKLIWQLASRGHNERSAVPNVEVAFGELPVGVSRVCGGRLRRQGDRVELIVQAHAATARCEIVPVQLQITYRQDGHAEAVRLSGAA